MKLSSAVLGSLAFIESEASTLKCIKGCEKLLSPKHNCKAACSTRSGCPDGIYPVDGECNAYYQCANGIQFENQYCPEGLLFNGEVCDWPDNVDCSPAEPEAPVEPEPTEAPEPEEPEFDFDECVVECKEDTPVWKWWTCYASCGIQSDLDGNQKEVYYVGSDCAPGIHPHETECNKYFMCDHGHRWPDQSCPDGLLFNPDILVCDWPQNVECGSSDDNNTGGDNGTDGGNDGGDDGSCADGVHADPSDCTSYYQCANGIQFPNQYCPDGLLFNPDYLVCDWPENVSCGGDNNGGNDGGNGGDNGGDVEECADGIYPIEGECNGFYQCANGIRFENQYCAEGLLFNPEYLVCDWADNVDCDGNNGGNDGGNEGSNDGNNGGDNNTDGECADGIYPIEGECNGFYQCSHGNRHPNQYCPEGLLFNGQVCDWPENVDCGDSPAEPEEPVEPEQPVEPEEPVQPEPDHGFWQCYWSCKKNGGGCWGCWKECKNAPEPEPECEDGEQKAHEDCTKYYSCQDGAFVEQSCAWGLRYHAEDEKCTFMFLVDC